MKLNLLKKLLCLSPVVISPILVTACGSSDNGDEKTDITKVTAPGKFYLDFYQRELNAIWATKTAAINAAANDVAANHQYDLGINLVDAVLPKVKTDGASEFKREFPKLDNYDSSVFDDITVSFSIPDDSKGNLKLADNGMLSIYPTSVVSGSASEKHIDYTLKLNSSKIVSKETIGSLKFNLKAGFVNYSSSSADSKKLANNKVSVVYGNADMSNILVGCYGGGLDVGAKQVNGEYNFTNYSTSSSSKLATNNVSSAYGNAELSTILVGEFGGGLSVGARTSASDSYTFTNYAGGAGKPLADALVNSVYGNADLSEILVGEYGGGLDVGTRTSAGDSYTFTNYAGGAGKPLANALVNSVYGNTDLSEIFVGETNGGLDVGTRQADGNYTFNNYSISSANPLANNVVNGVYGNADMSTILVGEDGGGLDIGTKQNDKSYKFTNYNASKGLVTDFVTSVYGNTDLSTILVGERGGGLDIGTKQGDGNYTFVNYNSSLPDGEKLAKDNVYSVYGSADLSTILVGELGGGLDISSNLWFA